MHIDGDQSKIKVLTVLLIIIAVSKCSNGLPNEVLPCKFSDSINITAGEHHQNGSITFNGIEYSHDQYASIDYIEQNGRKIIEPKYDRGCPCMCKPCIRLCCPYGSFTKSTQGKIEKCVPDEAAKPISIEVHGKEGNTTVVPLDHFSHVDGQCKQHYFPGNFKILDVNMIKSIFFLFNFLFEFEKYFCLFILSKSLQCANIDCELTDNILYFRQDTFWLTMFQ